MKTFSTYDEQIELLKSQGLVIKNEEIFLSKLKDIGFYNLINGYAKIFKNQDNKYKNNVSEDDILALYKFDKDLRNVVYKYTLIFESKIKSHISYVFSKYHGENQKVYLNQSCFDSDIKKQDNVEKLINNLNEIIGISSNVNDNRYRNYIGHYVNNHGHIPLWVLVRTITLGQMSKFYHCMKINEKDEVANEFNLTSAQLENMFRIIVEFRNVVAHDERLFCKRLNRNRLTFNLSVFNALQIKRNPEGVPKSGVADFLSLMITFKYVLKDFEFAGFWQEFMIEREILIKNIKSNFIYNINNEMGLKNRWKNLEKFNPNKFFYYND